jgi:hypothetical protein
LGTNPVFYNTRTGLVSLSVDDVIEHDALEVDPEGLDTFLSFGYCALGLTPIRHVRFLPPCSELRRVGGKFHVTPLSDPANILLEDVPPTREGEVLDLIRAKVQDWESKTEGPIVVPTSGGFDSRLLTLCVRDRKRVRAFTYGTSHCQSESREVVVARRLSEILGTVWEQVELRRIHVHMDEWYRLFGCATHAHGMYHIAFYRCVRALLPDGEWPLLSGIIGDVWAGNWTVPAVEGSDRIATLARSYGMNADPRACVYVTAQMTEESYLRENRELLSRAQGRIVLAARFKMMLLRYLLSVPESCGFRPWSPFLDPDVALAMLRLPADRRRDRTWQRDFFRREGVDMESMGLGGSYEIALNRMAVDEWPLLPLSVDLLSTLIEPKYTEWINRLVTGSPALRRCRDRWYTCRNGLMDVPYLNAFLYRCGFREERNPFASAYGAYMTLWPLQRLLLGNK